MAEAPEPIGMRARITGLVWAAGLLLILLIAAATVARTVGYVLDTWAFRGDLFRLARLGALAFFIIAALGGLALVVTLARRGHEALAPAIGIAAVAATRIVAIVAVPTYLRSDWLDYHQLAIGLASGAGFDSARAPGWPFALSLLYRVGGPDPLLGELFNLGCSVAIGVIIYLLARRSFGPVAAAAGLFLWAMLPAPALFTVLLASEFLFTLLFVATVALAVIAMERGWGTWALAGIILGLSQYVRPAGLVLVPAFAVFPFVAGLPRRRAALAAIALVVAFLVALGPAIAWQYQRYGRLSLSTSNYDGWNLLVGLNVAHEGGYNHDDEVLVGADPRTVEFRDRSYQLAIERLTAHPDAVAILAMPKFGRMWGDGMYGSDWALASKRPRQNAVMGLVSQVGYLAVVLLAAAHLWIRRRERDPVGLVTILCLGGVAVSGLFLESQPRYHAFFEPLFCLFAGVTVAWVVDRWPRRTAADWRASLPWRHPPSAETPGPRNSTISGI